MARVLSIVVLIRAESDSGPFLRILTRLVLALDECSSLNACGCDCNETFLCRQVDDMTTSTTSLVMSSRSSHQQIGKKKNGRWLAFACCCGDERMKFLRLTAGQALVKR
jgi:hypothetical protein